MAEGVNDDVRKALHDWIDRVCDEAITLDWTRDTEVVRDYDEERRTGSSSVIRKLTGRHTASIEWITEEPAGA